MATLKASCQKRFGSILCQFILAPQMFKRSLLKRILMQIPKSIVFNIENPLLLSDFLTSCLDMESDLQIQILGLRTIFLLLERHGLDYPQYYERLYALLLPQYKEFETISVFSMNLQEKTRFLRLLDLSLRSNKLPSKIIAAFMKRLCSVMISHGQCYTPSDKMYVISLIANLIKRHPRCVRLIHRK